MQFMPLCALEGFSKNQPQHLIGSGFCCQMGHINAKSDGSLRIIVLSNQQLPQRVWASAQQSLSKRAFAFALHHICTLPETTLVTTKRLQVYPRDSTKTPPTASIERGDGKASFCRRQFKRVLSGLLLRGGSIFCNLTREIFFPNWGANILSFAKRPNNLTF